MSVSQFGPTCTFPSASTRLATFFSCPASGIPRAYDRLIAVLELLAVKIASDGVKTLDGLSERLLLAVAKRSARVVLIVAVVCYPGIALVVPLIFDWPSLWLVVTNVT